MELTDQQILALYRMWSEDAYCAGFVSSSEASVRSFRRWLADPMRGAYEHDTQIEDYEREMIDEFCRQESIESEIAES